MDFLLHTTIGLVTLGLIILIGILFLLIRLFKKVLVITGFRGIRVGTIISPVLEKMDITLKTIAISRTGTDGLVCKDNMRADIKVTFFTRVNQTHEDVKQVAQPIGCERASHQESLVNLFDAKFSEALKTVGKCPKKKSICLSTTRIPFAWNPEPINLKSCLAS